MTSSPIYDTVDRSRNLSTGRQRLPSRAEWSESSSSGPEAEVGTVTLARPGPGPPGRGRAPSLPVSDWRRLGRPRGSRSESVQCAGPFLARRAPLMPTPKRAVNFGSGLGASWAAAGLVCKWRSRCQIGRGHGADSRTCPERTSGGPLPPEPDPPGHLGPLS